MFAGANAEIKSSDKSTPLHLAASNLDAKMISILIEKGNANVNALTVRDETPLDLVLQLKKTKDSIACERYLKCRFLKFKPKKEFFNQLPFGTQC